jgi:V8-like Glu-specific endopeptidase
MPDSNWLVEVKAARRGSGFLIAPGLILTSWHVLKTEAGSRPSAVKVRILGNYRKGQHASRLDTDDADLVWPSLGYEPDSDHDLR